MSLDGGVLISKAWVAVFGTIITFATGTGSLIAYVESKYANKEYTQTQITNMKTQRIEDLKQIRDDLREMRTKTDKMYEVILATKIPKK